MEKCAFIFPGQASQYVGMGQDLCATFPAARACFDEADEVLGYSLSQLCFSGPEEELRQTVITQPAVFVHSAAAWQVLVEAGLEPVCTAGHSLGEYTALVAAGAFSFRQALELVKRRSELMQRAGEEQPGTMVAIIALEDDKVEEVCRQAADQGVVVPANFNAPGQVVLSGELAAVERAGQLAQEAGAKRVIGLAVGGAFHSPLMAPAAEEMKGLLEAAEIAPPRVPVVCNVTATATEDPEELRRRLIEQITHPVRWSESVLHMVQMGVERAIEVGPGKVLKSMVRRIARDLDVVNAGTAEEVAALEEKV